MAKHKIVVLRDKPTHRPTNKIHRFFFLRSANPSNIPRCLRSRTLNSRYHFCWIFWWASKLDPHFQCVTVVKFEKDTKVPQCDLPKDALPLSFSLHIVNLEWQKH